MMSRRGKAFTGILLTSGLLSGCIWGDTKTLHYLGEAELQYYKGVATEVDYAIVDQPTPDEVKFAEKPRTVLDREKDEIWDMTLAEALHTALANNAVIRSGTLLSPGNSLLNNPNGTPSIFDPAIQNSGVLFGGRGVEAALAAFDAQVNASMIWGRNERPLNNAFFGGGVSAGNALVTETGNFAASISKQFAYGGQFAVNHTWDYTGTNAPSLFSSSYVGLLQAQYRHPLLAGAGPEFTRIAGPITQSFGGITGVNQGVAIARINTDIAIADFEISVRNLLLDVERTYWDLYLAYRNYDTAITARNSALRSWREAKFILEVGGRAGFRPADEAQARDQFYATRSTAEAALSQIYFTELQLRRLLGLPVNDGRVIRPADEPTTAQFSPDWYVCLTEGLTQRVELRRQKWSIKSLELQLQAARSLTRPRLDFVSGYQVNALGDRLLGPNDYQFATGYGSLTNNDFTGWNLGFEFNMPLGFRSALAQVRNIELRLAKAREVLAVQEMEISHELAAAFQELAVQYTTARSNYNRYLAAQRQVELFEAEVQAGTATLDLLLRAQASRAQAESAYHESVVRYNQALADLQFRKGTLLEHNNVQLAESEWTPDAYIDALRRAWARSHAFDADHLDTEPGVFSSDAPVGGVELVQPADAADIAAELNGVPGGPLPPEPAPLPPTQPPLPPVRQPVPPAEGDGLP